MLERLLQRIRANDPTLTTIDLSWNHIGEAGAQALAEALKINTSVTTIALYQNNIGDAGAQALAEALKTNTSVKEIDLKGNNIGEAGAQALAEALKINTSVTTIALYQNNIGDAGEQAVQQIMAYTSRNELEQLLQRIRANDPTLTTINLSYKDIGAAGAQALAEALKTNTSVTTINLHYNNIGDAGSQALAKALKTNTSVTTIYLFENNIGDAGAQALAEALKTNTSVTKIYLTNNKIGAAGAQALAEVLKTNTSVTKINLSSNKIRDAGAQALAEALKTNTTVSTIDLHDNKIGDAGAQSLAEALKTNTSLTEIDLRRNDLRNNFQIPINDSLKRNLTNAEKLINVVQSNDSTAVKELLALGASVNYQDENGKTALQCAIQEGRLEIVYLLLNSLQLSKNKTTSSLVNEFNNENGNTLLHQAVLFTENNPEIANKLVERLLAFGAKRYVRNHAGQYPFQVCIPPTTEEQPELANIRNLLKPTPAEQLFIDHIANNPHIKPLIEKLSKTLVAMDDLMVTLRSDKTKHKYQLPGDLVVRLLFEELQLFRTHIEQNDFDCEEESAWEQFFATCLSNYPKNGN